VRLGRTVFSGGILFTVYETVARVLNAMFIKVSGVINIQYQHEAILILILNYIEY